MLFAISIVSCSVRASAPAIEPELRTTREKRPEIEAIPAGSTCLDFGSARVLEEAGRADLAAEPCRRHRRITSGTRRLHGVIIMDDQPISYPRIIREFCEELGYVCHSSRNPRGIG